MSIAAGRPAVRGVLHGARQRRVRGVCEEALPRGAALAGGEVQGQAVHRPDERNKLLSEVQTKGRRQFDILVRVYLQHADETVVRGAVSRVGAASLVGIAEKRERKLPHRA